MTKVLLTGGSGFIAAHVLETLLQRGHSVVTTVRSQDKAKKIHDAHPSIGKDKLETLIVPDIAKEGAFDEVVKTPGLEAVLHTASPFHFKINDPQKDLIDPAVIGTTGILKAITKSAPGVKRVVITSSFAAILDKDKITDPNATFTEKSWNPVTIDEIHESPAIAYRASKKLAEKAAWDYVQAGAGFDLVTVNPPMVFGPVVHYLASLDAINTSNERFVSLVQGGWRNSENKIPDTGVNIWVDVRDVALAHVLAIEKPELAGRRLFTTAGYYSNREILDAARKNFPELADKFPAEGATGGEPIPADKTFKFDNSETTKALGFQWTTLETTTSDTLKSLIPFLK
ncbi:NAD(P)-binding protein [Cryphonectria parasitica EP155]|uniref:NAD(P)-binding protein n=1 Tax=Cryphonectria parasitica (strain ATCC 38755 / EP155) TaxID=660469 RepID=A0A9P4Y4L0_CRYP1|nr:NAD(P)-binding protein [Cryphonectria parasitica EP155]KAF3766421.1 NAD(P)-binding protein [Cryphonectria parasitica EP155]